MVLPLLLFTGLLHAGVRVGTFKAEVRAVYSVKDGLPAADVRSVAIGGSGEVYAATRGGLARLSKGRWYVVAAAGRPVERVTAAGERIWFISDGKLSQLNGGSYPLPPGKVNGVTAGRELVLATEAGLYCLETGKFVQDTGLARLLGGQQSVRQVAVAAGGRMAVAAHAGLFLKAPGGVWHAVYPRNDSRSWAPYDVRGVAFDSQDRLWFASPQGTGCQDAAWKLYTGSDGLPYDDFTTLAAGENGAVWFGTKIGAIRFDGKDWEYRQGLRWLPGDEVRAIAVNANGDAWFATDKGAGVIERRPMTLAGKAKFFEDEIDKRHRRTEYGYIYYAHLRSPGDTSEWELHASDNDGLYTAMYGAAECFAYGATRDPLAGQRAKAAFEALRFLGEVTQGGSHPAPRGFVARAVLPTGGPDPNRTDSKERDEKVRATRDPYWKVLVPRWPVSADGKWYWKTDSSSDELDGHFFFYGLYYDLVAGTEAERARVREHVGALAEHLVDHNFQLVDHDGKPTRWAVFNPENLNQNFAWRGGRGMNSLSILAYMKVAGHITGNPKFAAAARVLIEQHSYASNVLIPKADTGPGSGNQADDEMIFMNYYNLIRYETDPGLRRTYATALTNQWKWERPELSPFFNFVHAASLDPSSRDNGWLEESVDSLKRYPLDRIDWRLTNSHRKDIIRLPGYIDLRGRDIGAAGYRVNGKVLPIDERWVGHWGHDPWELDQGTGGRILADGESYLLPYYMGLYHRYILE